MYLAESVSLRGECLGVIGISLLHTFLFSSAYEFISATGFYKLSTLSGYHRSFIVLSLE